MRRLICFTLIVLSQTMVTAAEKPSIETLTRLAEQYLHPHSRGFVANVEVYEVDGLWEAMQTQILKVRLRPIFWGVGSMPGTRYLLYHDGALQPIGSLSDHYGLQLMGSLSDGTGLLSVVVADGRLYYSYSYHFGSGAFLKSFVGQVTVQDGRLSFLESESPYKVSLAEVDGRVRVCSGQIDNFDSRTDSAPIGWLKLETTQLADLSRLVIVDDYDEKVDYQSPYDFGWLNAASRWIVMPERVGDEMAARFRIETPELFGKVQSSLFPAARHPIDVADHTVKFVTDADPPLGECMPRECWIDLARDEEDRIAALFSIRE